MAEAAATLLAEPAALDGNSLEVGGDGYRHLFRARRLGVGDRLRVVDGGGRARWGRIERVGRGRARLALEGAAPANEPAARLELLVAPPRPPRAAWLVEKATELGVVAVRFVASERAPRRYGGGTLERLGRVAAAAVEQCHRSLRPELTGVHEAAELERLTAGLDVLWRLAPGAAASPRRLTPGARAGVLVGPEGGWTQAEAARLDRLGAETVGLGPTTLRIETAAVAAAAAALVGG